MNAQELVSTANALIEEVGLAVDLAKVDIYPMSRDTAKQLRIPGDAAFIYTMEGLQHLYVILDEQGEVADMTVLVHELKHAEQVQSGRLRTDLMGMWWEGKLYPHMRPEDNQGIRYFDLPWEREAYQVQFEYALGQSLYPLSFAEIGRRLGIQ